MGRQDLHALLLADLNIVQYLNGLLVKHTLLRRVICATTSRSRLKDISIALWIVFSLSAAASGFPYLWTAVINAIVALSAQYMLSCRRPLDFVAPLCDTKRTDPDTFGFPCIDTHLSVIVLLPIITNASNLPYRICAAILLLYIPITRILTASRFVYQIIGSVSTGLLCAFLGRTLQPYSKFVPISSTFHQIGLVSLIFFCVGIFSFNIENNQSRVLGIQRQEFTQVFKDILQSDPVRISDDIQLESTIGSTSTRNVAKEPAHIARKKDSFYYLVQTLRKKDVIKN